MSTDLFGRGIDIERVNIVVNYDFPEVKEGNAPTVASDQYLHRVGRAGRFGTKGLAISFISSKEDADILAQVQSRFEVDVSELPDQIDISSYMDLERVKRPRFPSLPALRRLGSIRPCASRCSARVRQVLTARGVGRVSRGDSQARAATALRTLDLGSYDARSGARHWAARAKHDLLQAARSGHQSARLTPHRAHTKPGYNLSTAAANRDRCQRYAAAATSAVCASAAVAQAKR